MEKDEIDHDFKVVVLGLVSTGKSSFINRLISDTYQDNPVSTANVQFYEKKLEITFKERSLHIRLKIWDTAGAERYMAITQSYLRNAHLILLFFDINSPVSFTGLDKWWEMVNSKEANYSPVIYLIGNKCDLDQKVTDEEIEKFCEEHDHIKCKKVSPKNGTGVEDATKEAVMLYLEHLEKVVVKKPTSKSVGEPLCEENMILKDSDIAAAAGKDGKGAGRGCFC